MGRRRKPNSDVLKYQINNKLQSIFVPGESRHQAKNDGTYIEKIYSVRSFKNYREWCNNFANYVGKYHPDCRKIEDAKIYVDDYIQKIREEGKSPYTQKSYLSALRKLYNDDFEEVKTDKRCRANIVRSRSYNISNRKFSETKNADFIHFCQHTGLRRSEVERLHGGCVSLHSDGHYYINQVKGKGGKVRDVRILNDDIDVINKIMNTSADHLVWGIVSNHANIHGWRADYAEALYKSVCRDVDALPRSEVYHCQRDMLGVNLDREAMRIVSNSLGHNRLNVIAENYLYNLIA